ncbi:alpha/beta hydrolase [Paenibacillus cymbidii]|uniref:alpha/beta hydrolase n=1 Tax=Paenibacillus cymbidii TaxID=1639034 RepID=UPI00108045D1|nr:alpha/beta hydrolase [Paenibacillus cymbidii]
MLAAIPETQDSKYTIPLLPVNVMLPEYPLPESVEYVPDIEFASVDGRMLKLDLLKPAGASGKCPVVLYIHGGGWHSGTRKVLQPLPLAMNGYAVVSTEYRLSGEAPFPAQLKDCQAAIHWIALQGEEWGLDKGRLGIWGNSAGAHLAALLGLLGEKEIQVAELPVPCNDNSCHSSVRAVVASAVAADLNRLVVWGDAVSAMLKRNSSAFAPLLGDSGQSRQVKLLHHSSLDQLFGVRAEDHPDLLSRASPVAWIHPDAPPFLLLHGEADLIVPVMQAYRFHNALEAAGAEATLVLLPEHEHSVLYDRRGEYQPQNMAYILSYLDRHL